MEQAAKLPTHYLADVTSGEGYLAFTPSADGLTVELFQQDHPDLPGESSVLSVEAARDAYRRAVKSGWVPV